MKQRETERERQREREREKDKKDDLSISPTTISSLIQQQKKGHRKEGKK